MSDKKKAIECLDCLSEDIKNRKNILARRFTMLFINCGDAD